jgi:hypothetical protein
MDAPDATILSDLICKPADIVDDDKDNVAVPVVDLTLNCNLDEPLSKTICGSEFAVVPVGYIITLAIMLIDFLIR